MPVYKATLQIIAYNTFVNTLHHALYTLYNQYNGFPCAPAFLVFLQEPVESG